MRCMLFVMVAAIAPLASAQAAVTISSAATSHMICSGGVCSPTSTDAVLNVGDLETLLAAGNVVVTTTGSGIQATDIELAAPLSWTAANMLSLDAYESISVNKTIAVQGAGGLSVTTNDGGSNGVFSFGPKGHVRFANLSDTLAIDGARYALEGDIASLASAIAANPSGNYALAADYDASGDTFTSSPIPTIYAGSFQGLGNTISNIAFSLGRNNGLPVGGLFSEVGTDGSVRNIVLARLNAKARGVGETGGLVGLNNGLLSGIRVAGKIDGGGRKGAAVGGIAGTNDGIVESSQVAARVSGNKNSVVGGLAGYSGLNGADNIISNSSATGTVKGGDNATVGGLLGVGGSVYDSYATGAVTGGNGALVGGAVGHDYGDISNCYVTGAVTVGENGAVGGFYGVNDSDNGGTSDTYSTGLVQAGTNSDKGGFLGEEHGLGSISQSYFDKTTSDTQDGIGSGGGNEPGITGLTTTQLQSGLPVGFDPTVWAEDSKIDNGLPYLIANRPPSH